jgi:hypothetical protein
VNWRFKLKSKQNCEWPRPNVTFVEEQLSRYYGQPVTMAELNNQSLMEIWVPCQLVRFVFPYVISPKCSHRLFTIAFYTQSMVLILTTKSGCSTYTEPRFHRTAPSTRQVCRRALFGRQLDIDIFHFCPDVRSAHYAARVHVIRNRLARRDIHLPLRPSVYQAIITWRP